MADIRLTDPMKYSNSRDLFHLSNFSGRVGSHIPTSSKYWFGGSSAPKAMKSPTTNYVGIVKRSK